MTTVGNVVYFRQREDSGPNCCDLIWLSCLGAIPGTVPSNALELMVHSKSQGGTSWSYAVQMPKHNTRLEAIFFPATQADGGNAT